MNFKVHGIFPFYLPKFKSRIHFCKLLFHKGPDDVNIFYDKHIGYLGTTTNFKLIIELN